MKGRHDPVESKCIVVANEPRSYREAMAVACRVLCPEVEVILAEPADLDAAVVRLDPQFVLCSRLTEGLRTGSRAWVLLYPEGEARAVISVAGRCVTTGDLGFAALAALIDQAIRPQ
jgi:hypothetical protein